MDTAKHYTFGKTKAYKKHLTFIITNTASHSQTHLISCSRVVSPKRDSASPFCHAPASSCPLPLQASSNLCCVHWLSKCRPVWAHCCGQIVIDLPLLPSGTTTRDCRPFSYTTNTHRKQLKTKALSEHPNGTEYHPDNTTSAVWSATRLTQNRFPNTLCFILFSPPLCFFFFFSLS